MPEISRLTENALRLLVWVILAGEALTLGPLEWMRITGIRRRESLKAAREELAREGLVEVEVRRGTLTLTPISEALHFNRLWSDRPSDASHEDGHGLKTMPSLSVSNVLTNIRGRILEADDQSLLGQAGSPRKQDGDEIISVQPSRFNRHGSTDTNGEHTGLTVPSEPVRTENVTVQPYRFNRYEGDRTGSTVPSQPSSSALPLLDRCVEADSLPREGGPFEPGSPWRRRRDAQRELVKAVWARFFPTQPPLTNDGANSLLKACDECAEDVYNLLEETATRTPQFPLSYALGIVRNRRSKAQAPVSVGSHPTTPAPEPEPEYLPINHELLAQVKATARELWGDDDD